MTDAINKIIIELDIQNRERILYLSKITIFDNWIKRNLKVKEYLRYVDDFILFGESKEELLDKKLKIEIFLKENLNLELRNSFRLRTVGSGIDFLGYIIRPKYILVRKRVLNNFKYKLAKFVDGKQTPDDIKRFREFRASYFGHFQHSNSYQLFKKYKWFGEEPTKEY